MNPIKFHCAMAVEQRKTAAAGVNQLLPELQRLGAEIDRAEKLGQPTRDMAAQWSALRERLCLAWDKYRRASRRAAAWANRDRARIAARRGRA